jgi:hypothetical protein
MTLAERGDELATLAEPMPVLRAIRAKCIDCCYYRISEVARCTAINCPLWPFRHGELRQARPNGGRPLKGVLALKIPAMGGENPRKTIGRYPTYPPTLPAL